MQSKYIPDVPEINHAGTPLHTYPSVNTPDAQAAAWKTLPFHVRYSTCRGKSKDTLLSIRHTT